MFLSLVSWYSAPLYIYVSFTDVSIYRMRLVFLLVRGYLCVLYALFRNGYRDECVKNSQCVNICDGDNYNNNEDDDDVVGTAADDDDVDRLSVRSDFLAQGGAYRMLLLLWTFFYRKREHIIFTGNVQ